MIQGTLDLLILRKISQEPRHGWAIAKRIVQISEEVLQVSQRSLYPALHRLSSRVESNRNSVQTKLAQWELFRAPPQGMVRTQSGRRFCRTHCGDRNL